jgi:hypothetical protein
MVQVLLIFVIQILGQVSMILAMMGSFNGVINYDNIGGIKVNK